MYLWQKFDQYDRARPFGAWARGIAAKRIMQSFEKLKKVPLPLSPQAIQAVLEACDAEVTEVRAEQEALRRCLEGLPEKSRELVRLRYEQDLKLKDIAGRVQGTLDAVHKTLSRLRVALRKCVEQQMAAEAGGAP